MKIPASIRDAHSSQFTANRVLKERVDKRIEGLKDKRWHYESRLKDLENFAIKLESGRCPDPFAVEDFFACTLVVRNGTEIKTAEDLVLREFELKERRPRSPGFTHKGVQAFPFDDLRLYVRWKDDEANRPTELPRQPFEVQIKTFLFHAWSIATHDLVYKSDKESWGLQRIAYQIRAMLEHAEVSIQEADTLAESEGLRLMNKDIHDLSEMIDFLHEQWPPDALPKDLRRLAQNFLTVARAVDMSIDEFRLVLNKESEAGSGKQTLNLSPYGILIQSLLRQSSSRMKGVFTDARSRTKILVPSEIELPNDFNPEALTNAIFVRKKGI